MNKNKPEVIITYTDPRECLRLPILLLGTNNASIELLSEEEHQLHSFKVHTEEAVFYFISRDTIWYQQNRHSIEAQDNIWEITYHGIDETKAVRQIYVRLCDTNGDQTVDMFSKWMDDGHIIIMGPNFPKANEHTRFFQDYFYSLWGFYFRKGYCYQNIINDITAPKTQLVGCYYLGFHNSPDAAVLFEREDIMRGCKDILGDDLQPWDHIRYEHSRLFDSYQYLCQWERAEMHGINDIIHSVAHISWESRGSVADGRTYYAQHDPTIRDWITEKTVKALLYSGHDIFFIHATNRRQQLWLRDQGFWFLNWEFQTAPMEELNYTDMLNGMFGAAQYIKNLKTELKTNEAVHKHLMEKYGDRVRQNYTRFMEMLSNGAPAEHTQRLKTLLLEKITT